MTNEEFTAKKLEIDTAWRTRHDATMQIYSNRTAGATPDQIKIENENRMHAMDTSEKQRTKDYTRAGLRWIASYEYTVGVVARDQAHADELAYESMEDSLRDRMNRGDFYGTFKLQDPI